MITNKGTGAGGANTNKTGLSYENSTDLSDHLNVNQNCKFFQSITFKNTERIFIRTKQYNFYKYMVNYVNKCVNKAHGCKNPDECYVDEVHKRIFIIEKKFQQTSGSVCEKI